MPLVSLKGYLAQRRAVKQLLSEQGETPPANPQVETIHAHYTIGGLSLAIKMKDGAIIQKRIPPTPEAIADFFLSLGG